MSDRSYRQIEPSAFGLTFEVERVNANAVSGFCRFTRDDGVVVRHVFIHVADIDAFVRCINEGEKYYGDLISTDRGLRAVNLSDSV